MLKKFIEKYWILLYFENYFQSNFSNFIGKERLNGLKKFNSSLNKI